MPSLPLDATALEELSRLAALPPDQRAEALEREQERRWAGGNGAWVENFLAAVPALKDDRMLLLDLVHNEQLLRVRQGERPPLQEYCERFPDLAESLGRLLGLEELAKSGGAPDRDAEGETTDERPGASSGGDKGVAPKRCDGSTFPGVGDQLGGYRLVERIGAGGMGTVYRAEDIQLQRAVALKVVKRELAADTDARQRFLREARSAAQLKHDHIVRIYHVGEDQGVLFLVMELLHGESLQARVERSPSLTLREIYQIGRELAAGLAAAHQVGLIHRDVKPANVFLEGPDRAARVKLLDFGLARPSQGEQVLTKHGALAGTPGYMAPEQAMGDFVDARSDLFGLGCVLYRLTTGVAAFRGGSALTILQGTVESEPRPPHELRPDLPKGLSGLILRLLAKDPDERPASAEEVVQTLSTLEQGQPLPARIDSGRPRRSRQWLILSGVAGSLALLLGLAFLAGPWTGRGGPATNNLDLKGASGQPIPASYRGAVQLDLFRRTAPGHTAWLRLGEPGAQPLELNDQFRLEATVAPAAYVYLFLINADGTAAPLYPWSPGDWSSRPARETATDRVRLPATEGEGWTISEQKRGMITFLLAARPDPWPAKSEEIQALFAGLGEQQLVDRMDLVWFDNGRIVTGDPRRGGSVSFQEQRVNHPIFRLQERLREQVQPQVAFTSAVSVATGGKR